MTGSAEIPPRTVRPGTPGSPLWAKDDRALASILRRAIVNGQARIVTTDDGRWWLQVDRAAVSMTEREMLDDLARATNA